MCYRQDYATAECPHLMVGVVSHYNNLSLFAPPPRLQSSSLAMTVKNLHGGSSSLSRENIIMIEYVQLQGGGGEDEPAIDNKASRIQQLLPSVRQHTTPRPTLIFGNVPACQQSSYSEMVHAVKLAIYLKKPQTDPREIISNKTTVHSRYYKMFDVLIQCLLCLFQYPGNMRQLS